MVFFSLEVGMTIPLESPLQPSFWSRPTLVQTNWVRIPALYPMCCMQCHGVFPIKVWPCHSYSHAPFQILQSCQKTLQSNYGERDAPHICKVNGHYSDDYLLGCINSSETWRTYLIEITSTALPFPVCYKESLPLMPPTCWNVNIPSYNITFHSTSYCSTYLFLGCMLEILDFSVWNNPLPNVKLQKRRAFGLMIDITRTIGLNGSRPS